MFLLCLILRFKPFRQTFPVSQKKRHLCFVWRNIYPWRRKLILEFFKPCMFFPNMRDRRVPPTVNIDLYLCGWPCQPFATQGALKGEADERGDLIWEVCHFLTTNQPSSFILENVPNLVSGFQGLFLQILKRLEGIGGGIYNITWDIMNVSVHGGLPQARNRLFIVGIKKTSQVKAFEFPAALDPHERLTLDDVLDSRRCVESVELKSQIGTVIKNVQKMRARLQQLGHDPQTEFILNAGGTVPHFMEGTVPTITATRAAMKAYWSSKRNRPLTTPELMRLQGVIDTCDFPGWWNTVSERQMGHICGNAICVRLLARIIRNLLVALGQPVR